MRAHSSERHRPMLHMPTLHRRKRVAGIGAAGTAGGAADAPHWFDDTPRSGTAAPVIRASRAAELLAGSVPAGGDGSHPHAA